MTQDSIKKHHFWNELSDLSKPILPRPIPKEILQRIKTVSTWQQAREVSVFLSANFGNPPKTPILQIPPSELFENSTYTFVWIDTTGKLHGCIRYRPWAQDKKRQFWQVDCFCIDKNMRSKGIGTWLLKYLHSWANTRGIPFAIFLKEGQPLPIPRLPFRTGIYAFMDLSKNPEIEQISFSLKKINPILAQKWVQSIISKNELFPIDICSIQSSWYLYNSAGLWLIIRAEKTNQVSPKGYLGWLTDIYESPSWKNIGIKEQTYHITVLSKEIAKSLNWSSIWIDSKWVEIHKESPWNYDGPYYFYGFQW